MSHTTRLKTVSIKSITAVRAAVQALQAKGVRVELKEKVKPRAYYGETQIGVCDYVLYLPDGQYDVGLDRQEDGTYAPVFDEWGSHVGRKLGADVNACPMPTTMEGRAQHQIGQFMQEYTKAATIEAAIAQGYMVESATVDDQGQCHLVLAGM